MKNAPTYVAFTSSSILNHYDCPKPKILINKKCNFISDLDSATTKTPSFIPNMAYFMFKSIEINFEVFTSFKSNFLPKR